MWRLARDTFAIISKKHIMNKFEKISCKETFDIKSFFVIEYQWNFYAFIV